MSSQMVVTKAVTVGYDGPTDRIDMQGARHVHHSEFGRLLTFYPQHAADVVGYGEYTHLLIVPETEFTMAPGEPAYLIRVEPHHNRE